MRTLFTLLVAAVSLLLPARAAVISASGEVALTVYGGYSGAEPCSESFSVSDEGGLSEIIGCSAAGDFGWFDWDVETTADVDPLSGSVFAYASGAGRTSAGFEAYADVDLSMSGYYYLSGGTGPVTITDWGLTAGMSSGAAEGAIGLEANGTSVDSGPITLSYGVPFLLTLSSYVYSEGDYLNDNVAWASWNFEDLSIQGGGVVGLAEVPEPACESLVVGGGFPILVVWFRRRRRVGQEATALSI